jgi:hypothetical protein
MSRKLALALVLGTLGTGCGVGGDDGGGPMMMMPDAAEQPITCTAKVTLTGTFTASIPLDPIGGCQPQGTWVVTATVADKGTCANVPLKAQYNYTLTGMGRDTQLTYATGSGEEFTGAVNASGSGGCEGSFEHVTADGSNFDQLNLKPILPPPPAAGGSTLTITGTGEFDLWKRHP